MTKKNTSKTVQTTTTARKTQKVETKAGKAVNPQPAESKDAVVFTPEDKGLLEKQESVIASNIGAFLLIGEALSVIKGRDLQKVSDPNLTFDQYCSNKWGFGQAYAYRLISGFECVKHLREVLSLKGVILFPANEAQVRPLTNLSPEEQVEAWSAVLKKAKGGGITAAMVDEAVTGEPEKSGKSKAAKDPRVAAAKAEHKKLRTIAKLVGNALKVKPEKRNLKRLTTLLVKIQKLVN